MKQGGIGIGPNSKVSIEQTTNKQQVETYIEHFKGNIYYGKPAKDPSQLKKIYNEMIVSSTAHVSLRGLLPGVGTPESKPIELANVYIDLDIARHAGKKSETLIEPEKDEISTALQAFAENEKIVLLGDPGSGKSTFIRFVSHCLAQQQLDPSAGWLTKLKAWPASWVNIVPLIVVLRDFAGWLPKKTSEPTPRLLMNFIKSRLKDWNMAFVLPYLEQRLRDGEVLILLDGLDEVGDEKQRGYLLEAVRAFMTCYAKNKFIVTCRVLSYLPPKNKRVPDLRLNELALFSLIPFSDEKINQFIDAWYCEMGSPEKAQTLKEAISKPDSQLSEFASNPLLLTEMAWAQDNLGKLPDERVKLYDEIVNLLLYRWDEVRFGGPNTEDGLLQLLKKAGRDDFDLKLAIAELALNAHESGKIDQKGLADIQLGSLIIALEKLCDDDGRAWAAKVIDIIQKRAGLLIEREPGVFTFPHRTFQEYMAGIALTSKKDFIELVKEKALLGDNWRLAIILAAGFMDQIKHDLEKVLLLADELCPDENCDLDLGWRNAWLAGDIILEIGLRRCETRGLGKKVLGRVRNCLANLLTAGGLSPMERKRAGDTLARLGDPRFDPDWYCLPKDEGLGFVRIPEGEFRMGSDPKIDKDAAEDEFKQHKVFLKEFYMARYPVTVAQYSAFVKESGYRPEAGVRAIDLQNHPVRYVTWFDAIKYCEWLDGELKKRPDTPQGLRDLLAQGWKVTLPSEAEWEKAARGTDGRLYPWDLPFDSNRANTAETGIGDTSAVGSFPLGASPYQILDMSGNVWEWTRSLWGKEFNKPEFDYPYTKRLEEREDLKADENILRVLRGGSFSDNHRFARCAFRLRYGPYHRNYSSRGVRVVIVSPIFGSEL